MPRGDGNILIDDAEILFRNFSGRETDMNPAGSRNFCVLLEDDLAKQLEHDGWNIKQFKEAREEGETPQKFLPVALKYRGRNGNQVRPPEVFLITSKGRTRMDEESVEVLDFYDIKRVDLIIRPYEWGFGGKSGLKAYVKTLYFFVAEDALALRYQDIPEIGADEQIAIGTGEDDVIDAEAWYEDEVKAIER